MVCDYMFSRGICCNGHFGTRGSFQDFSKDLLNPTCGYLGESGWTAINPMPERLCGAASLPMNNKDMLIVSGGTSKLTKGM